MSTMSSAEPDFEWDACLPICYRWAAHHKWFKPKKSQIDRNIVLMLDTCFSGRLFAFSGAMSAPIPSVPAGFVRIIAASGDELANWNEQRQLGLFTSLFLDAVGGAADAEGFGDQNGRVEGRELEDYLRDRLPPEALRITNGLRQQTPVLDGLDHILWAPTVTRAAAAGTGTARKREIAPNLAQGRSADLA